MRKALRTLLAVCAAGVLIGCFPRLLTPRERKSAPQRKTVRVWVTEEEPAVARWLKKEAAAYEKETGRRIYLRAATEQEALSVRQRAEGTVIPDLIVETGSGEAVALRGYALFLRDDTAALPTPAPTGMLFSRPAPSPGPTPEPGPDVDVQSLSGVLAPACLMEALPGTVLSAQALSDLVSGKAAAALLTAGEGQTLGSGYRAWALPEKKGFLTVGGNALSSLGGDFIAFLRREAPQRALSAFGLYSPLLRLYDPTDDPLRAMIERSWFAE